MALGCPAEIDEQDGVDHENADNVDVTEQNRGPELGHEEHRQNCQDGTGYHWVWVVVITGQVVERQSARKSGGDRIEVGDQENVCETTGSENGVERSEYEHRQKVVGVVADGSPHFLEHGQRAVCEQLPFWL